MSVQQCPCFNLGLAHRKVVRAFEEALAPLGLTIAQAHFLTCLYAEDGQLPRDVARELGVDAGTLTPMIDRLVRLGFIRRCPHPDDRRAVLLCLTPEGRALEPQIDARSQEVTCRLMNRFSEAEYRQFMDLIGRMVEAADATPHAPDASAATR